VNNIIQELHTAQLPDCLCVMFGNKVSQHAYTLSHIIGFPLHKHTCAITLQAINVMASPNDRRKMEERKELEEKQKMFLEKKKAVFEKTKEADEELQRIRQEEMAVLERLQELNEMEQLRQALEGFKSENAQLKRGMQEKQSKSLDDTTAHATVSERKIERLEAELSFVKEKVAVCEREHGGADDVNEMKEEIETLRQQNVEQSAALSKVNDAMQRMASYSRTQQQEKDQAIKRVASLQQEILEKESLQMEVTILRDKISEKDALQGKVVSLEAELSYMKERVAVYEQEHGGADDVNEMKEELEALRRQSVEHSAALRSVEDAMQRVTSYSRTQQQEKEQALKRVADLQQEILEKESLQMDVASLKGEILEKDKLQGKLAGLEAELSSVKEKVAICEREHGGVDDVNELKEELETLRQRNVEQSAALRKVKDAMQRVTSYSKTQQKKKEKLRREMASLKDEIAALKMISEETQQRQLDEILSTSTAKEQPHQQSTGKFNYDVSSYINTILRNVGCR